MPEYRTDETFARQRLGVAYGSNPISSTFETRRFLFFTFAMCYTTAME